jgi:hypothetical protein
MTVKPDFFTVASFALWAGDYRYLDEIIEKISKGEPESILENSPEAIIERIGRENLAEYKKKRDKHTNNKSIKFDEVFETDNLRAKIWQVSEFEYCLRGYLKTLNEENKFFSRINPESFPFFKYIDNKKPENYQRKQRSLGKARHLDHNKHCLIRIDEMGLIESTFFVCENDSEIKKKKVISCFKDVLTELNDGEVNTTS